MTEPAGTDDYPEYWRDYSNLQRVKHKLLEHYLRGWLPKLGLGSGAGRVLYVDAYAGRGRHQTGDLGSPLIALDTLLKHRYREQILAKSEVRFVFMERHEENYRALAQELSRVQPLPRGVAVDLHQGECEGILEEGLAGLRASGHELAPAFVFVDPWGFKIPYSLLAQFMTFRRVELLVNVMFRELDMALAQAAASAGMARTMDYMFGEKAWRGAVTGQTPNERAEQTLALIQQSVGARWQSSMRMLRRRRVRYMLAHFTNHDAGRDLMKEALWKTCSHLPEGIFIARAEEDPAQGVLLSGEPDLGPLEEWILARLCRRPTTWQELHEMSRSTSWLKTHVNRAVRALRDAGKVRKADASKPFYPSANPLLVLGGKTDSDSSAASR